jgi:hypothetical protein
MAGAPRFLTYLPSKKFITVLLTILLVGAGGFLLSKYVVKKGDEKPLFERNKELTPVLFQQNSKDSDNDGLADWEETLWKTDPNNPDTDNDGTLDGEEVKLGRNPVKPGPDDKYSSQYAKSTSTTPVLGRMTEDNETEKLTRDFISQYLANKIISGESLDEASKENLVNSLFNDLDIEIPPNPYSLASIKVLSDNNQSSLKNYSDQFLAILKKYNDPPPTMEVYYFQQMIQEKDETMVKELEKSVATYEGLKKDFLNLAAPPDLKNQHLQVVNSIALLKDITEKLKNYSTDPLGALIATQQYIIIGTDLGNVVKEISDYLKGKGVDVKF